MTAKKDPQRAQGGRNHPVLQPNTLPNSGPPWPSTLGSVLEEDQCAKSALCEHAHVALRVEIGSEARERDAHTAMHRTRWGETLRGDVPLWVRDTQEPACKNRLEGRYTIATLHTEDVRTRAKLAPWLPQDGRLEMAPGSVNPSGGQRPRGSRQQSPKRVSPKKRAAILKDGAPRSLRWGEYSPT
jgi:hypothetical protein